MSLVVYASSDEEGAESDENSYKDIRPVVDVRPVPSVKDNLDRPKANAEEVVPQDYDIEDEDDWGTVKSTERKSIFSVLPPPSKKVDEFSIQEEDDISDFEKLKSDFQTKENAKKVIKENANSLVNSNNENEDGKRTKKLILPKPKSSGDTSSKQTMKITLPDVDSDSDDDINERKPKARVKEKKGTGLLGLLPKPKNSVRAQVISVNKPTERKPRKLMVPYTLSKKKEEAKKIESESKDSGSDSEEESTGSFFSFGESVSNKETVKSDDKTEKLMDSSDALTSLAKATTIQDSAVVKENKKELENKSTSTKNPPKAFESRKNIKVELQKTMQQHTVTSNPHSDSTQASRFKSNQKSGGTSESINSVPGQYDQNSVTGPYGVVSGKNQYNSPSISGMYGQHSVTGPYGPYNGQDSSGTNANTYQQESVTGPYGTQRIIEPNSQTVTGPYQGTDPYQMSHISNHGPNIPGMYSGPNEFQTSDGANNSYGPSGGSYMNPAPSGHYSQYQETNQPSMEDDTFDMEQLRRLQGKRERRVQQVDFIDIQGENMQMDSTDFLKNFTEEKTHISKKMKSDNVSSQQKRKHQITYLAFQAKEREQELRKSWATNHSTKRQTQQKYGF